MLREDKAIVTNIAGTTRDIVEGEVNIGGIVLKLVDTAGIRETDDMIERIGVEKSKQALDKADLAILVLDNNKELDESDKELLSLIKNKKHIVVINKRDLKSNVNLKDIDDYLLISTFDSEDINKLEKKIKQLCLIDDVISLDGTYIGNARQIGKLKEARQNIVDAIASLDHNMPIDIANIDIKNAWTNLGEILGEVNNEDLINELFARFCLGK